MDYLIILFSFIFASTFLHFFYTISRRSRKNLPPGPSPLPIFGSLHLLGKLPHKSLFNLSQIYGPIMCLKLGQKDVIVISSAEIAREALQKQDLVFSTNRATPASVKAQDHHIHSVVFLPISSNWRNIRRIMNTNIFSNNKLDFGKNLRSKKIEELVEYCRRKSLLGEAIDIGQAAFRTSLNLLANTIFSKDLTDPFSDSVKEFKELVWNIMVEAGKPNLVDYFPFLEKFDPMRIRHRLDGYFGEILELFGRLIEERLEQKRSESSVSDDDVLDVLLNACRVEDYPQQMDKLQIQHCCLDLFAAGTDTTSSTLEWAMTEMLKKPEIMRKAKEELEKVVGKGNPVDEDDLIRLPYLQCIIKETLRLHPPVPFLIPRRVDQNNVHICGYTVPNGSQVLVNVWGIGRDPSIWEDPLEFSPQRFLNSHIDVKGLDFELIPFGAGRRICPGLSLAIRIVPLMLGSLVNSFDWKLNDGGSDHNNNKPPLLDMEDKFGITVQKALPLFLVPIPV